MLSTKDCVVRYKTLSATLLLSVAVVSIADAGDIFKWVDGNGDIHYTDKPIDETSERLDIESRPTDNASVLAQTQARMERQQAREDAAAGLPPGPTAEEKAADAEDRSEKCSKYQQRLTKFTQSHRIYRHDEDGERVYLDDNEMQNAINGVEQRVEKYCD